MVVIELLEFARRTDQLRGCHFSWSYFSFCWLSIRARDTFDPGVVGWCDGAGKLPVPGRHTNLDWSRALAVCVGGGCLDIFSLVYRFSFLSPSLWETARYRLKYCLKGPLSPKQ